LEHERDLAWAATEERFATQQENLYDALGYPATAEGKAFYDECIPAIVAFIQAEFDGAGNTDAPRGLKVTLRRLDLHLVAVSALTALIHSPAICSDDDCQRPDIVTMEQIGSALLGECRRRRRTVFTPRKESSKAKRGRSAFRSSVWTRDQIIAAGGWLQDCVVQALPEIFVHDERGLPRPLNTAIDRAVAIAREAMLRSPIMENCKSPPTNWTGLKDGGYWTQASRLSVPFVRGHDKRAERAVGSAMAGGTIQPHVDAVNSQQSVAWTIDEVMLDVVKRYGPYYLARKPGMLSKWVTIEERWHRRKRTSDDLILWQRDIAQAERLVGDEFFTPMNVDWRGRIYGIAFYMNHQRQDWARCLFRFKRGIPIGEEGIYWLKIYTATTGDFDRISKRPLSERICWIDQNIDKIHAAADRPFDTFEWWSRAGKKKKYQFLAACRELSQALRVGPVFESHLPIAFDASASGIQHLCAMARAPEGALVNLIGNESPADVYELVAARVKERLWDQHLAAVAYVTLNRLSIDRALVKKCVMTYFYNSGPITMAQEIRKTLRGTKDEQIDYRFVWFLVKHIRAAIEDVLPGIIKVMKFFAGTTEALAAKNKSLSWVSPSGMPVCNRYHIKATKVVEIWLSGKRHQYTIAIADSTAVDPKEAKRAAPANFVHSMDAAHMALVTNAAADRGIVDVMMVHDSFGCHAANAALFRDIIREQFVRMYEDHDVLAELRAAAAREMGTEDDLPPVPPQGALPLREILKSDFAFD
jgi:DNA-directed RNA polymerase, mitochondrial